MTNYQFLPAAEEELNDAARFYEERATGLGSDFLKEVDAMIASILAHPKSGRKVSANVRRRIVRRFPFGILYVVEPDRLVIVAVAHLRRRPGYWMGRLEETL